MVTKSTAIHEGKLYYSMSASAKLLGISIASLKKLIIPEGFVFINFRVNGPLWIEASSIETYMYRQKSKR